jgi:N-acetylmuramoyl-L-alanine amidase
MKYLIIFLTLLLISCATTPLKSGGDRYGEIDKLIKTFHYQEAEDRLIQYIEADPENRFFGVQYVGLLYKTERFHSCLRLSGEIIDDINFFSTLPKMRQDDLYFYHLISAAKLGELSLDDPIFKQYKTQFNGSVSKVKQGIIEINHYLTTGDYKKGIAKIKKIQKGFKVNLELELNLSYLEAFLHYKMGDYSKSVDIVSSIVEHNLTNGYLYKVKELLDKISQRGDNRVVTNYKSLLIHCYNSLLNMNGDYTFANKINRSIYLLDPEDISISLDTKLGDTSALTTIRVLPDGEKTSVLFGSNDSIRYSDLNYDKDSNLLSFKINDKNLNYSKNSITPPDGVGIDRFSWSREGGDLSFELILDDDYEIAVEKLHDNFEKNVNAPDRYQLLLSIYLPKREVSEEFRSVDKDAYTIVLDPGHGGDDAGAVSVMKRPDGRRYYEKEMNMLLCNELKIYLEKRGYNVFLTRTGDYYPDLVERNRIALQRDADMFLSIHMNSGSRRKMRKWQTDTYIGVELIMRNSLGSVPEFINKDEFNKNAWLKRRKSALREHRKLSQIFDSTISRELDPPFNRKRTVKKRNLKIFSGLTIPHALIETGFIINNKNLKYFLTKSGREDVYRGIFKGIEKYRKGK